MSGVLPQFPYYADPIGDERIVRQDITCGVCGLARTWASVGEIYGQEKPETLCPWCVADGQTAARYDGQFQDADFSEETSAESVTTVLRRTPRVVMWNPIFWPDHCGECCTYLGGLIPSESPELAAASDAVAEAQALARNISKQWDAKDILECAESGSMTVHLFQCRQCGIHKLSLDGT